MARITFHIPIEKKPEAVQALKTAIPTIKNAHRCLGVGEFNIPDDLAAKAVEAIKPFTAWIKVNEPVDTSDTSDSEVEKAVDRLVGAFDRLEERVNARAEQQTAKLLHGLADFIEKL